MSPRMALQYVTWLRGRRAIPPVKEVPLSGADDQPLYPHIHFGIVVIKHIYSLRATPAKC